ncbi:hypothetical protein ACFQPF_15995 [Fictibacillus iocasae]|uniref:Membrane protein YkvI n=1 Tax=Fictibacillus iocasae TaxID=2715437 RepID=A0ABW2NV91_9BACL
MRQMKQVLQIAATYIGTVVGAGFATGREIVEFFTSYGSAGFAGILISGLLFMVLGTKIMLLSRRIQAASFQDLNVYLFGVKAGRAVNGLMAVMLFGVTAVMLSGSGALFSEQLKLPFAAGVIVSIVLTIIVYQRGMSGLLWTNSFVVPIMIGFSMLLSLNILLDKAWPDVFRPDDFSMQWKWGISAFAYASFNLSLAQAVLVPLSREAASEKVIKWGGIMGGAGLTFILLNSHFALYAMPDVLNREIPVAELVGQLGAAVHLIFVAVVFGEIFTTLIGNLYGLCGELNRQARGKSNMVMLAILLGCALLSQLGYSSLLHYLYPAYGIVALVFLVKLWSAKID